jgi:hypothetical protein
MQRYKRIGIENRFLCISHYFSKCITHAICEKTVMLKESSDSILLADMQLFFMPIGMILDVYIM